MALTDVLSSIISTPGVPQLADARDAFIQQIGEAITPANGMKISIDSISLSSQAQQYIVMQEGAQASVQVQDVKLQAKYTVSPDTSMGGIAKGLVQRVEGASGLTDAEKNKLIQYIAAMDAAVALRDNYSLVSSMITVSEIIGAAKGILNKLALAEQEVKTAYDLGRAAFDKGKTKEYTLSARLQTEALAYDLHGMSFNEAAVKAGISVEEA